MNKHEKIGKYITYSVAIIGILMTSKGVSKNVCLVWLILFKTGKADSFSIGAPIEKESAFPVLNRISHTRQTFFDTPFEVINIPIIATE